MAGDAQTDLQLRFVNRIIGEKLEQAAGEHLALVSRASRHQTAASGRLRLAVAVGVAALLAALGALPARAATPEVGRFEFAGSDVFTDSCGPGVDLIGEFTARGTVIVSSDADGKPTSERLHFDFFGTLTRSDTGHTISDPVHVTILFDFVDGTRTETGLTIRRTYPGEGLFAHDVGRLVGVDATGEIVFLAGPHDVLLGGSSIPAVCAALA